MKVTKFHPVQTSVYDRSKPNHHHNSKKMKTDGLKILAVVILLVLTLVACSSLTSLVSVAEGIAPNSAHDGYANL